MSDYNDDGEKSVNYLELTVSENGETTNAQYNSDLTALQRFNTEVASGNSIIYLVNEAYYERLKEFDVLAKLTDVLPASAIPAETVDEYGVYLRELEIHFAAGFSRLPGSWSLCIRRSPEQDDITYGRTMEYWRGNQLSSAVCLNTSIRRRNRGEKSLYTIIFIFNLVFYGLCCIMAQLGASAVCLSPRTFFIKQRRFSEECQKIFQKKTPEGRFIITIVLCVAVLAATLLVMVSFVPEHVADVQRSGFCQKRWQSSLT